MKIKNLIISIGMLFCLLGFTNTVYAHSPQDIQLEYEITSNILNVTITHNVINPDSHYVYKVEIEKNNELIQTHNYDNQPTSSTFTYDYNVEAVEGDTIKTSAFCSIGGSISKEIVVTDGNNQPPSTPSINGPSSGNPGVEYDFIFMSIDPNNDDIFFKVSWGCCGPGQDFRTYGPFKSGEEATIKKTYGEEGTYSIQAYARDVNGAESDIASLEITMPKTHYSVIDIIIQFLENHPIIYKILQLLT
jgi:hypothetical protein